MAQKTAAKDYSRLLALICVLLPVGARPAIAQNITPARDGTGTVINNQGQQFDITGGQRGGNGANLFHSFQQFNLDAGQTANFVSAPNIDNILGRVTGGNASIINGLIQVTGGNSNLYLMNPAGVIFGPSARLDVPASFSVTTATGIGFGNNWFNAVGTNDYHNLVGPPSGYRFDASQPGAIVNSGNLEVPAGEDLTLTGGTVINTGELSTSGGNVTIAAVEGGDTIRISQQGHLLNLEVSNFGGNQEEITPLSLPGLLTEGNFDSHATGLRVNESGEVVLTGDSRNQVSQISRNQVSSRNLVSVGPQRVSGEEGTTIVSGNIDTSSSNIGGQVNIVGQRVGILDANINADGINGGGDIFIGGAFQGNSRLPASQQTVINNNSFISANALENGDGGRVIIWSDGTTRFEGNISATGGEYSGNGGLVEVSGKRQLLVNGFIDVGAENGEAGTILFDPENITVDELAADVEADVADGLAADVEADVADGLSGGETTETTSERAEIETRAEVEEIVEPFAPDADYNVTISAENIENLEGNVALQADNDITVNQEINTSESVELKAGRSININADIDTSRGNGNINLFGNDNGANVANRSRGAANINQRENTTLNAGSGDITLRLGNLGRVGDINVENLTTTGRVLINANGGNIGRVSPNSLITAGNATFRTSDAGSIGLSNAPLRLDVENLEAEVGTGGAFFNAISDVNIGGTNPNFNGILSQGEIDLSAVGDVTVSERMRAGGNVSLAASDSINVNANINSSPGNGDITLRANDESLGVASRRGRASITQLEGTKINAGSGDIDIDFGALGNTGDISLANLTTTGTVRVNASVGNILRVGEDGLIEAESASFETFGEGGIGSAELPLRLNVQNLEAVAGSGGAFFDELTGVTVGGVRDELTGIVTTGGGDVELSAGDRVVVSEGISTNAVDTGDAGNIRLESRGGGVDTTGSNIGASATAGKGGDVALTAVDNIETGNINANGSTGGGSITLESGGNINTATGILDSSASGGDGGNVLLDAGGDVVTGTVDASVNIDNYEGFDGSLFKGEDDSLAAIGSPTFVVVGSDGLPIFNIVNSNAGDITIKAGGGIDTTRGSLISTLSADLNDNVTVGNSGSIALTASGNINTSNIISAGSVRGVGGAITIASDRGAINTTEGIINSAGGDVTLEAVGEINTDSISSNGNTGGAISITSSEGGINTTESSIASRGFSGTGGDVTLEAVGEINTGSIDSSGSTSSGAISITSSRGGITTEGNLSSSGSSTEVGGNVTLEAAGEINTGSINSSGSNSGGAISITSSESGINTNDLDASSSEGTAGEVRMQAESSIIAGSINTLGSERGGNITLTSNAGDVTVPELEATSAGGNNGEITINANTGSIEVGTINLTIEDGGRDNPFSNNESSNITADADTANGQTGEVSLQAHNDITINEAIESAEISSLKLTAGRNVNINADIDTSAGNGDIRVEANSQNANPELRETGPGSVNMAAGTTLNAGAGDIVVTLELGEIGEVGNINLANLTTTGTITVNANGGDILRVGENSVINAGMAAFRTSGNGSIGSLEVPLRLDADNLEAISGRGGAFFEVLSGITVGGVRDDLTGITTEGGDVEMNVAGNLTVRENISASINLGDGGNITLESGGAIQISAATMTSTATEGAGGDVTLEAVGEINTGSINSSGSTSGGAINITSSGGGIATENSLSSSGYSTEVGGNVTLEAAGDINTGSINSSGSTSGGAISITSSEGRIDTAGGNLDTSSEQGTAGNAILTADRNITTSNIDATGGQQSGNITIESRFGDVDISRGQLEINSENGTDGNLNIQAFTGSISLGDIDGTRNLTVAPDGEGNPFGDSEPSSSITSDADLINSRSGTVTLQAHNDITINERIESSSLNDLELRAGRNININADIDTSGSNGNIALKANDEGANADYRMPGAGSVRMATGTTLEAGSGDIVILLGNFGGDPANIGNITLGNLATTGSVTVNAGGGNIFRASPNSLVRAGSVLFETGGSGGIGSPRERLRVSVDNLEAIAGSGGAFFRSPTQGLTIAGITTAGGGDVGVRVNGDITVTAPISTAIPSGDAGNITLIAEGNGNIDTSAAGLDASSFSELNNGGTVKLEAGGNITSGDILTFAGATSTSTTISSAGDGGSIVLNSGGDVNTSAGSINSSAFSELGNGGNVTFKGDGNITTGNVYAYSWLIGNGGNISLESGGNIDTSRGRLNSYSWSGNGGNVKLATTGSGNIRTGDIYSRAGINGQGGSIILNSVGDINTTAIDETNPTWLDAGAGGGEGSGGDIELRAGGDILTGDIRTFAGGTGEGGDITIDAGGSVDTAGGRVFSSSVEGNTGSISITAETEVTTGDVNLASGFRVDEKAREENPDVKPTPEPVAPTSGVAGDITITSSNGTIDTSAGVLDSRSPDGSGNINLTAPGNITTGTINASALNQVKPTEGGDIEITSSEGDINATGPLETFSEIGTAGNVTLDAAGSANTRDILSDGDERGGDIAITSDSENTINVRGRLDTFSENGTAGDVTLNAVGSVNARDIRTFGQTQSGNITINSGSNVTTGSITTQAPGGDSGNIRVNGQNVATGNLRSLGRDSAGGIRVQATDGSIRTEDIEVRSEEGTAGPVELEATEDIETEDIEVTAQEGDAEIDLQAGGDITGGDQTATTEDGSASITNTAEGNINLRDQIATATGGDASINNVAGGNITAGDQTAVADGGDASINNVAGGNITAGDQTAVADGGDASINNEAGGDITAGDQTAISFGGDATITNIAEGDITVGDQTALSEGGNAFINNEAGGNLTTGDQTAVAPDGINQVTNNAGGTINTGELTEGGSDITPFLRNNPVLLVENDVAQSPTTTSVSPTATLPTPSVSTPVVTTQTPTPSVSTPVVENSPTAIATNDSLSNNSSIQNAVTATGNPQSSSNSNSSITSSTSDTQQTLETISAINSSPMSVAANTQTLTMLEESRNQEFAEYLGLDLSLDASAIKNAREVLALMTEQTGKHSAVVYVSLYAEELQLILYTAEGEPILKTIPGVKREEVIETVQQFRANIVTSLRLRNLKTYLPPAQQLYQWLIAPLAAELESANIDTLLFSMDEGLRGLPVAALHDGEQFLIERYSLSMIPSISLMDSRYNSVKDTQVLAMGASEFTELNSLPAVPVELETITTELWQGNALIDEEFTVSNLIAQRQQQTYPIIHLATHGEFKAGDAGNSYIQFWGEEKLPLDRVRELGLNNPPVELLVLSACRTAVGDSNAELGFAGLAVAAGAKSALASLWYVSDEGTLGLMTEFYNHLDDVTIKAEALRQAQLAMLRGEVEVAKGELRGSSRGAVVLPSQLANIENNNLSHPYYWSGFTMIGSPW